MKRLMGIMLLLISGHVLASGCEKPRDDFDGVYCLNKVYHQADNDLNTAYTQLRKKLDKNARKRLKIHQLGWIKERNSNCSLKSAKGFFVNLSCATQRTIERTNFLNDRYRECISAGCLPARL